MILPQPRPTKAELSAMRLEDHLLAPRTGNVLVDSTRYTTEDKYDNDKVHALLTLMVCPVMCRGYLDGTENWHELCLDKADRVMTALGMYPPVRPALPIAPQEGIS